MFLGWFDDEARLKRRTIVALWLLLSVGVLFMVAKTINELKLSHSIGRDVPIQNLITVNGMGEAIAIPDTATLSFTVTEEAATVATAQQAASKKIDTAVALVKKEGVGDGDIKTLSYGINPKYEYDYAGGVCTPYSCPPARNPRIVGYEVSQTIEVKVRALDNAPALLTSVGGVGVRSVSGIFFSVSNEKEVQQEARKKAINEAKSKAKELANDLGVRLVRITNFSEGPGYAPYGVKYLGLTEAGGMGGDVLPVQVPAGENKVVSYVYITYEIR